MKTWKEKVKLFAFALISMTIPLLALELIAIILDPILFQGFYQYDSDLGFRVRPYYNGANRFGFNDRDRDLAKKSDVFRILVLGDSFGWAGGKQGNYTALLEKSLQAKYGSDKVEVINVSYPGIGTPYELKLLQKFGLQYQPDLVVLGFFVGNDFLESAPHWKRIVVADSFVDIDDRAEHTLFGYPILPQSRLLTFIQQKYKTLVESSTHKDGTFWEETFLNIEFTRMDMARKSAIAEGKYKDNIANCFTNLTAMSELLKQKNIKFAVAIYPDEFQINETLQQKIFDKFKVTKADYDLDLPQRILTEHLKSKGIDYLDMLEAYRSRTKSETLYALNDTHWNEEGRKLAANLLLNFLTDKFNQSLTKAKTTN